MTDIAAAIAILTWLLDPWHFALVYVALVTLVVLAGIGAGTVAWFVTRHHAQAVGALALTAALATRGTSSRAHGAPQAVPGHTRSAQAPPAALERPVPLTAPVEDDVVAKAIAYFRTTGGRLDRAMLELAL